jgi:hypothetical protein
MRQISLGINPSCSNCLRVQIIPQLHNILSNFFSLIQDPGEQVPGAEMAVEQAGAYSHFYGEEPEKT